MYYLVLVEIATRRLSGSPAARAEIEEEAKVLSEEVEKRVVKEDEVDGGFLVPVKNMWIVDKLRTDLDHAEIELERVEAEKKQVEAEKKQVEAEASASCKKHLATEIAKKDKEIASLKKRLGLD